MALWSAVEAAFEADSAMGMSSSRNPFRDCTVDIMVETICSSVSVRILDVAPPFLASLTVREEVRIVPCDRRASSQASGRTRSPHDTFVPIFKGFYIFKKRIDEFLAVIGCPCAAMIV
jgi:hypothetical protein